jgi:predicted anti-sigma-YlaC factor YlaD
MSTDCEPIGLLITASLDDELTDSEWSQLEHHLAGCAPCREELRRQEAAVLQLEGLDPAVTERDLWPQVDAALAASPARQPRSPSLALFLLLAAALFVTKGLDLALFNSAGIGLRIGLLAAVAIGFALSRINPFRLASEQELAAAARAPVA